MALHANWNDRSLLLWSGATAAELRDLVGQISSDALLASAAQEATLRLWLPQNGRLEASELSALKFSPTEAVDLLLSLPEPLPAECGDSVRYWVALARFVTDCVRREKFYPIVRRPNAHHEAVWRLHLPSAEELDRLERFANSMPPSCRAIVGEEATALGLIDSFLTEAADALIRRAVSNDPFFTRVHSLAAEPGAGPEMRLLSAMLAPDRTVPGELRDNEVLADQVQLWSSRLGGAAPATGWQVAFTLHEPPEDVATPEQALWRVTLRLQPLGDGKPLDAARLWEDVSPLSPLGRQLPELRSLFIAELTRAAEVFTPLARVLASPAPVEVELLTVEANQFLRQWSVELRARSFAVELPSWADDTDRRLSLVMALRPSNGDGEFPNSNDGGGAGGRGGGFSAAGPSRMGLDSLLEFDWRVSLGGMDLSPDEFDTLVRRQSPLVKVRGRWVEMQADLAAAALELMEKQKAGTTTLGDAFRAAFATSRGGDAGRAPAVALAGTAWVKDLLDQLPAMKAQELPQPEAFKGTLRPYQLRGLQWLSFLDRLGIGGCLADDMGLGKTIQLIALLLHERIDGEKCGPTLLFAPTSVVGNWVKELERFAPKMRVLLHHGPQRRRGEEFIAAAARTDVVITSYALAHRDRDDLAKVKWHRLALDEAQKIKNPSAASSVAIRSLSAPRRIALTGTPIENHLSELWSIMDVLNPGLLGSARDFRERFAVPIEKLLDRDRGEHLRRMIRPFVLRRSKTDPEIAGDLPDKIEMKVFCNLTPEQAAMYERATAEMLGQIDAASGIRRRGLILAVLTRLKQICDHPALLSENKHNGEQLDRRSGKCERLVDMLEEVIEEGESALVFTQYAQMGTLLQRVLKERLKANIFYLHGGTPQKQRDEMVQAFQDATTPSIFILSLRAGGLGLNLTAANHVFHFDRWWNPAVENQATDRAHRIGQKRSVQVHKFIAVGTVEERIDRLLTEKTQLAESIVGGGDEWLTDLSTSELREYLRLSDEAVGEF